MTETGTGFRTGKPNLLYFYWPTAEDALGQACKELEARVFVDGRVCELAKDFVCIRVNGKTCPPQVLQVFGVSAFPTMVFQICSQKIVSSVKNVSVDAETFAEQMQVVLNQNTKAAEALAAREAALTAQVDKANALKDAGNLAAARKTLEALLKGAPGSAQADMARAGLAEIKAIGLVKEAEALLAKGEYAEARGRLSVAADCEVKCAARDQARDLLPECDMGVRYAEGCKALAENNGLLAMETLSKIVTDENYSGRFKAMAQQKLDEIKANWGKRVASK